MAKASQLPQSETPAGEPADAPLSCSRGGETPIQYGQPGVFIPGETRSSSGALSSSGGPGWPPGPLSHSSRRIVDHVSGDTNSDPLPPVLIPTPIMPSCYRLSTPLSGSFLVFTSVSRWVCSGLTFVNLDRINPLLRFSRSR